MTIAQLRRRLAIERKLVRKYTEEALRQGWKLESVYNGADDFPINVTRVAQVMAEAFVADEAVVRFNRRNPANNTVQTGWFVFIYGNDGPDVLNDYTVNLEPVVEKLNALVDALDEQVRG